ncbi:MAG: hypothetical protein ABEJ90_03115 [Halobacterium sp.]
MTPDAAEGSDSATSRIARAVLLGVGTVLLVYGVAQAMGVISHSLTSAVDVVVGVALVTYGVSRLRRR